MYRYRYVFCVASIPLFVFDTVDRAMEFAANRFSVNRANWREEKEQLKPDLPPTRYWHRREYRIQEVMEL